MKTENENRKVVIVSANMCANEANKLYGDRYGYDWIYPTVTSFKTAEEIMLDIANAESYDSWGEMMYDTHEHYQIKYIKQAMEEYASQFKPTPSSTVDLEREAELEYPLLNVFPENEYLNDSVLAERAAYIKGRQTTSHKGLVELIEWAKEQPIFHDEAKILIEEVTAKATELLTKK